MSSLTLFIGPLISFVARWKTTASVSSHIYPFNRGIKCPILIPDVLYTQTAYGLSSFGFSCLASPRILDASMTHSDLTTGICLVKFALLLLADSPLIVLMECFLSLLLLQLLLLLLPLLLLVLVILLHSVGLLLLKLLLCRSLLTFRLFPSLLFGCLLFNQILLCDFFSLVFLAGLFFQFLIFYHFFTFRHFNSKTNAHFCACFYPILCFSLHPQFPIPILFGFLKLLFETINFFAHLYFFCHQAITSVEKFNIFFPLFNTLLA